ncbi:growth hormone-inducible transmembrane protein [Trichonephila inaurata madagascariensis]|uniref:Growth hormone-inducible transmembrane protein n=1 Tax=Trichonephila inaurata madagascariensis TaxID=2747483 RepID=A0A8X6YPJ5_9ARAC|nr:growth hormone-inducible transmembrane protein [Trichonephila inaurata madagascariensis]
MAGDARSAFRRARISARSPTLKERLMAPEQGTAFNLGKGVLLGASALGIGSLCYYGLGLSSQPGAIEKSMIWPQYVKDRIRATYAYFGGSIAITAASAFVVSQSPKLLNLMMRNSWLAIGATFAAMIGSGMIVRSIPYSEGFGAKQLAWMAHSGIMGAVVAPLCFLGGPILMRAAWYTAGVVGGLSTVAACAPSEKFLYMGGPLACGLGVVFAASLGSIFLPPTTALGAGLYSISMYGGLVLFGAFLLYDTQRIVHHAENHPMYAYKPYDPVNASISIYMDTLNIFIRIAMLLAGGGSRRK